MGALRRIVQNAHETNAKTSMATAVLLVDLQRDFLDSKEGRMPVTEAGAMAVLEAANDVLAGRVLPRALRVLVLNQFPRTARVANFFRRSAAIAGSQGAEPDSRLERLSGATVLSKSRPSAFSNPQLRELLSAHGVQDLCVIGVFAEGCVRSTVAEAVRLGYSVRVAEEAVASNAAWKKSVALWAMKRAGAVIVPSVHVF
jgi:nicotinamidase/pyrazinamidase